VLGFIAPGSEHTVEIFWGLCSLTGWEGWRPPSERTPLKLPEGWDAV
jgi:hypothetical protein